MTPENNSYIPSSSLQRKGQKTIVTMESLNSNSTVKYNQFPIHPHHYHTMGRHVYIISSLPSTLKGMSILTISWPINNNQMFILNTLCRIFIDKPCQGPCTKLWTYHHFMKFNCYRKNHFGSWDIQLMHWQTHGNWLKVTCLIPFLVDSSCSLVPCKIIVPVRTVINPHISEAMLLISWPDQSCKGKQREKTVKLFRF